MKLWQPNRLQWWVVWIVYAIAFLVSLDYYESATAP